MAGCVPERTEEQQQTYEQILPRLLAGENLKELSAETGIKYGTLSSWRSRATKSKKLPKPIEEVKIPDVLDVLSETMGSAETAELQVGQEIEKRNSAAELKDYLLTNAADSISALSGLRGGVQRGLSELSESISRAITRCYEMIDSGLVVKHAVCEGEITQTTVKMTPADMSSVVATLQKLQKQLAELHNLPLGGLNIANIKLDNVPQTHKHLHLHSSYGGDAMPLEGQRPSVSSVIDVTPSGEDRMEEWQRKLMNDEL